MSELLLLMFDQSRSIIQYISNLKIYMVFFFLLSVFVITSFFFMVSQWCTLVVVLFDNFLHKLPRLSIRPVVISETETGHNPLNGWTEIYLFM